MSDVFKDYKKQKTKKNMFIIFSSLIFALGINFFLFGSQAGQKIQTSVKNYGEPEKVVTKDIYLEMVGSGSDVVNIKIGANISSANELSISLLFDPQLIKLADLYSENKEVDIVKTSNVDGIYFITFKFKNPTNLRNGDVLGKILVNKLKQEKAVINIAQTNFISDNKMYELTNTSFEF